MATSLPRAALTEYIIGVLSEVLLVGDAEAPLEGGWDDDPNHPDSSYSPYVVLMPLNVSNMKGPVGDPHADYHVPYSLNYFGISRSQVDQYADMCREHLLTQERARVVSLSGQRWSVQQIEPSSIGGVGRTDATEPSTFSQSDVITVWLSRDITG